MITFQAHTAWASEDSAIIMAQSKRCRYRIVIDEASVILHGPGLELQFDREEDLPEFDSFEALAVAAILKLEEGAS
jgi:hypothetical protein